MARVEYYNSKLENKNVKKMLDLLAYTEGTDKLHGYNTLVGGRRINDLSEHPNTVGLRTKDGASTAFGRYQITGSTWRGLQKEHGFKDFSPRTQDLAAVALLDRRGALKDVERGNFKSAIDKLGSEWVSLPTSTTKNQGHRSWSDVAKFIKSLENDPSVQEYPGKITSEDRLRSEYERGLEGSPDDNKNTIQNVYDAYKAGIMTPQESADFEEDVRNNKIMLPRGASLLSEQAQPQAQAQNVQELPQGVIDAYNSGVMSREDRMELEKDIKEGLVRPPEGFQPQNTQPLGFFGGIKEAVTGADRQTEETKTLPNAAYMPERSEFSLSGLKTGIGTLVSNPKETAQIIKANFPNVEVKQDAKGNYLLKSAVNQQWYVIPPGLTIDDIGKFIKGAVLFAPAAATGTLPAAIGASALTQAGIEASQAATGGDFDTGEVLGAGLLGGVAPVTTNLFNKGIVTPAKNIINKALGRSAPVTDEILQAAKGGAPLAQGVESVTPPPILTPQELNETARKAAVGGVGSNKQMEILATQANPNPKVVEAAKRIGVEDFLQPDHVTTNQAYRELAQAVKTVSGSEARALELEGLEQVAKKADDIVTALGGTDDFSMLDTNVKSAMRATQQELDDKAASLYSQLRENIPAKAEAPAPNVLGFINQRADELGGVANLTPMERTILKKLSPRNVEPLAELPTITSLNPTGTITTQYTAAARANSVVGGNLTTLAETMGRDANEMITIYRGVPKDVATINPGDFVTTSKQLAQDYGSGGKVISQKVPLKSIIDDASEPLGEEYLYMPNAKFGVKPSTIKIDNNTATKQPTYSLLDDVRRDLTAARIKGQGIFKDADAGLIKKLEVELKKDQAAVVEQYGMGDMFKTAQQSVAMRKGLEDDMKALFGRELDKSMVPSFVSSTKNLPSGNFEPFIKLVKNVPEDLRKDAVASGLMVAFGKNAKNGSINFKFYKDWYEGLLRNKKSYAALMSNLPKEAKKSLSDLYRVSKGISLASRERIPTGRINAVTQQLIGADSLIKTIYDKTKQSAAGGFTELVTAPLGLPGVGLAAGISSALTKGKTSVLKSADALLASPEFLVLAKNLGTPKEQKISKIVARSKAFKEFMKSVASPKELSNPERFLSTLLQSKNNMDKE